MIFMIVLVLFLAILARKIARNRAIYNIQTKPYRYQIETRRSPWNRRGGGF